MSVTKFLQSASLEPIKTVEERLENKIKDIRSSGNSINLEELITYFIDEISESEVPKTRKFYLLYLKLVRLSLQLLEL